MLQIGTNRIDGKYRVIDLHSVYVPGIDVKATKFTQQDLYRECERLGVPNIYPQMGWQDLCLRLGVWIEQRREESKQ